MKTFIICVLSALNMADAFCAQDLASFRFQSTGQLMDDDLDLMLDPLELGHTADYRLFSNLSNLGTGQEEALGSSSDNSLVLGIGGDLPFVDDARGALFFMRQGEKSASPVGLDLDADGFVDLLGNGEISGDYDRYFDDGGDGLYDFRVHRDGLNKDRSESNWRQFIGVANFDMDIWRLGLRLSSSVDEENAIVEDRWDYRHYDLDPAYQTTANGDHNLETGSADEKRISLDIALQTAWLQTELGLLLSLGHWSAESDVNGGELLYQQNMNLNGLINETSDELDNVSTEKFERSGMGLELRYRRQIAESSERKSESFWELKGHLTHWGGTATNRAEYVMENIAWNPVVHESVWEYSSENIDGDANINGIGISGRWVKSLDERVRMAVGLSLSRELWTYDQNGVEAWSERDSTVIMDGVWDFYDEWVHRTSQLRFAQKTEIRYDEMRIPVGLEYLFGKERNWTFRLSASYTSSKEYRDARRQVRDSDPFIQEYYRGNGYQSVVLSDNEYMSTSTHEESATSSTLFAYGLGYAPTSSLQVDFMSFFGTEDNSILDASFYRNLRLSATFRF
jgi:hypothetical protein